jgi:sulfur-carrier protein
VSCVRVELPFHLRNLAGVGREITVDVPGAVSVKTVLDALEERYPMLKGTIRDQGTQERRAFLRFFACEEDLSHEPMDAALPEPVAQGREPLLVIGAIAGGDFASGDTRFAPA